MNIIRLKCRRKKCKEKNGGKNYTWVPRKLPVHVCPKCHSPLWDKDENSRISK